MAGWLTMLGDEWTHVERMGDVSVALPGEPERLELGEGQLVVADEFGDAFALFEGPDELLAAALGLALDQLYGVEWGTAEAPAIDATSERASFTAFGEDYLAVWRRQPPGFVLIGVARPEREARARAFIEAASARG